MGAESSCRRPSGHPKATIIREEKLRRRIAELESQVTELKEADAWLRREALIGKRIHSEWRTQLLRYTLLPTTCVDLMLTYAFAPHGGVLSLEEDVPQLGLEVSVWLDSLALDPACRYPFYTDDAFHKTRDCVHDIVERSILVCPTPIAHISESGIPGASLMTPTYVRSTDYIRPQGRPSVSQRGGTMPDEGKSVETMGQEPPRVWSASGSPNLSTALEHRRPCLMMCAPYTILPGFSNPQRRRLILDCIEGSRARSIGNQLYDHLNQMMRGVHAAAPLNWRGKFFFLESKSTVWQTWPPRGVCRVVFELRRITTAGPRPRLITNVLSGECLPLVSAGPPLLALAPPQPLLTP